MSTHQYELDERKINIHVNRRLAKSWDALANRSGQKMQMNTPRTRATRHDPPAGFVDGIGADDASFAWHPEFDHAKSRRWLFVARPISVVQQVVAVLSKTVRGFARR